MVAGGRRESAMFSSALKPSYQLYTRGGILPGHPMACRLGRNDSMAQLPRSMMSVSVLALVLACLLVPRIASAQFDAATVLGAVADATGARVPGATVTLKNADTGIVSTTITDSEGNYQFLNVRIGTYSVRAELQGFSAAIAENITIVVNARQRVDLTMKVGDIGETVVVTGAARLLESESSERGQVIGHQQIVNLPLNGRAYADLALLSPGVRKSSISESRDGSFNVNGLRSSLNNFILDGVDNNSYGTSNQGFSNQVVQVSPDAVEEFKVQTNNFSAEFGRAGGAVINATFRSGTNQFHGTAWEFFRNTALNATGFFKPSSGVKPTLNRNQFGGVFGGPILKDRAFFFVNYEGFRQVQRTTTFASIPTMAQRQGVMGKPVRNPLTNELYADGIVPQSADHGVRTVGPGRSARADAARRLEQLRQPATTSGLQRQVRHQVRSADQQRDQRLHPLQPPRCNQFRAAAYSGADEQSCERVRRHPESAGGRGLDSHASA